MSRAERTSFLYLLDKIRKNSIAIEVGSYCGGSTRYLAENFNKVYSIDINHNNIANKNNYNNVEWITGDSAEKLPWLINELKDNDISFVLIDADHSYYAVLRDINNFLAYKPLKDTILIMHDSWHPETRLAIDHANWNSNPFVHLVEKDFVTGDLFYPQLYGGFGLAYLTTDIRDHNITIGQSQDYMWVKCNQWLNQEIAYVENCNRLPNQE